MKPRTVLRVWGLCVASAAALAAPSPNEILAANERATGHAPRREPTLNMTFAYEGDGMRGRVTSIADAVTGAFDTEQDLDAVRTAAGFDGRSAWMKDLSGAVTPQAGGDRAQSSISEAYRRANAWWRPKFGGAAVRAQPAAVDDPVKDQCLEVAPAAGTPFDACFDADTHLLTRVQETRGFLATTTLYGTYRRIRGVAIPSSVVIDAGGGPTGLERLTLLHAKFTRRRPASFYARAPSVPADCTVNDPHGSTKVPFKLLNNHIYVDVQLNGRGPFRFIVDTGGHDIVTMSTARQLGLAIAGQEASHGGGAAVVMSGYARVAELQVGGARLRNQAVYVLDFQPPDVEGFKVDGMLGFELLRRMAVRIDYAKEELELYAPGAFRGLAGAVALPFVFYAHMPQIAGTFDTLPARYNIDTGSRVSLTLTKPFVDRHGLRARHPKGVVAVDGWGAGGSVQSYVTRAQTITLGSLSLNDVVTGLSIHDGGSFADESYEGNVGSALLKQFEVAFDYQRRIMYWRPYAAADGDWNTYDRAGLWVNGSGGEFNVADVTPGGAAEQAGLRKGDVIVAVDGREVEARGLSVFRQLLRASPVGTTVTLKVQGREQSREVVLRLADQI